MIQITDPRAPFATVDEALAIGHEHMRRLGWNPFGMVAEEQIGGYFVRISDTIAVNRGGRRGKNKRQAQTAEIGKITPHERIGTNEGDLCRRGGCRGRIEIKPVENCSCHISPPCGACLDAPLWCPECEWESEDA